METSDCNNYSMSGEIKEFKKTVVVLSAKSSLILRCNKMSLAKHVTI